MIYSKLWAFIKESRNYLLIAGLLFMASAVIGFIFPVFLIDYITSFMEQIAGLTDGMGFFRLFLFILGNNLKTTFIVILSGILAGVSPILLAVFNGYVLGFIAGKAVGALGTSVLLRLLPHGIFEIPALILSLGVGLRLGMFIFKKRGKRKKELIHSFVNSLKVFFYIILPLLVIAAIIESALIVMLK